MNIVQSSILNKVHRIRSVNPLRAKKIRQTKTVLQGAPVDSCHLPSATRSNTSFKDFEYEIDTAEHVLTSYIDAIELNPTKEAKTVDKKPLKKPIKPQKFILTQKDMGLTFRPLTSTPEDRSALFEHWMGLPLSERRLRFFSAMHPDSLQKRAQTLDFSFHRMLGVFHHGKLVSLVEWCGDDSDPQTAQVECAFSTLPAYQGRSLASALCLWAAKDAKNNRIKTIVINYLPENQGTQALCAKLGAAVKFEPSDLSYRGILDIEVFIKRFQNGIQVK